MNSFFLDITGAETEGKGTEILGTTMLMEGEGLTGIMNGGVREEEGFFVRGGVVVFWVRISGEVEVRDR